jgi:hypothetical protein
MTPNPVTRKIEEKQVAFMVDAKAVRNVVTVPQMVEEHRAIDSYNITATAPVEKDEPVHSANENAMDDVIVTEFLEEAESVELLRVDRVEEKGMESITLDERGTEQALSQQTKEHSLEQAANHLKAARLHGLLLRRLRSQSHHLRSVPKSLRSARRQRACSR